MNTDPERLMSNLSHDGLDAQLLRRLRELSPPQGAREAGWKALSREVATLGLAASLGELAGSNADLSQPDLNNTGLNNVLNKTALKSTALSNAQLTGSAGKLASNLTSLKWILGLALGGVGAGAVWSVSSAPKAATVSDETSLDAPALTVSAQSVAAPSILNVPADVAPITQASGAEPRIAEPNAIEMARAENGLSEPAARFPSSSNRALLTRESALLIEARAKLRKGEIASAGTALDELEARFPQGHLTQEREVLRIELLAAKGDKSGAARRVRAFQQRYPKSPHNAPLARFLEAR